MVLRAGFFDMGDTLVTTPELETDPWRPLVLKAIERDFGSVWWAEPIYAANIRPGPDAEPYRQETDKWLARWLEDNGVSLGSEELNRLRIAFAQPLPPSFRLAPGASDSLRWCKSRGMQVIVLTNTLSRGDEEARADFARFGVGDLIDDVFTSYDTGWEKPHRALFDRALKRAGVAADQAFMVGDRLDLDVAGAGPLGIRTVWLNHRSMRPATKDPTPDAIIETLEELPGVLAKWDCSREPDS